MLTAQTNLKDTFNLKKSNKEYSLSINGYFGEFYISFDSKNKLKEYLYKAKEKDKYIIFRKYNQFYILSEECYTCYEYNTKVITFRSNDMKLNSIYSDSLGGIKIGNYYGFNNNNKLHISGKYGLANFGESNVSDSIIHSKFSHFLEKKEAVKVGSWFYYNKKEEIIKEIVYSNKYYLDISFTQNEYGTTPYPIISEIKKYKKGVFFKSIKVKNKIERFKN